MLKLYMEYQLRPVSTACGLDRLGTGLKTAKDRVRRTKTGSLRLRTSLLCFPNLEDRSRSRSFKFGPKDRTGPDFKALLGPKNGQVKWLSQMAIRGRISEFKM